MVAADMVVVFVQTQGIMTSSGVSGRSRVSGYIIEAAVVVVMSGEEWTGLKIGDKKK